MEKQVVYNLYKFSVNLYNGDKTFYFEFKEDAKVARFVIKKDLNKQSRSVKEIDSIVSPVRKVVVMEKDLDKYKIHPNYDDFENYYFELTEKMCEESLTK